MQECAVPIPGNTMLTEMRAKSGSGIQASKSELDVLMSRRWRQGMEENELQRRYGSPSNRVCGFAMFSAARDVKE